MIIAIKFFEMFAGIGGFRSGLEQAGSFECIGFCEIDCHAATAYRVMYEIRKDGHLYRLAGNIASVPVIKAIGEKIRDVIFKGGDDKIA